MKRTILFLFGLTLCATAQAQSTLVEWVEAHGMEAPKLDAGQAPEGGHGVLTVYANRVAFDAVVPPERQACENYEDTNIPPGSITGWPAPFDASTNNAQIPLGSIVDGLVIQDNPLNSIGGGSAAGLATVGAGAFGVPSRVVVANTFVDSLDLLFTLSPTAVALDVYNFLANDAITVTFYDESDVELGNVVVMGGPAVGGFVGVTSPTPIGRANISATIEAGTGSEGGDDICFTAAPSEFARFFVTKTYDDGNTTPVEVTLSCNTGLPLQQTIDVAPGEPINFVVGDFEQGTLDCEVTEVVPTGYAPNYDDRDGVSESSCSWDNLEGAQYFCDITNYLQQVEVEVDKVWIDENPQFQAQNVAEAYWSCSNVAFGTSGGYLQFSGNPGSDSFWVYPDWDSGTTCSITEVFLLESGIEVDDSDCQGLLLLPGTGDSCTIFNTRLYEGIPTLSQYGLAVLALMLLGVGFVAYRRLI